MVSSLPFDTMENPTDALHDLYSDLKDISLDAFPSRVTTHFTSIFAASDAFETIPSLSTRRPPEQHQHRALVRFRAMIQDTSISPEVYLARLPGGRLGGWGLVDETAPADPNFDYSNLRECSILWAVSIPGEWSTGDPEGYPEHQPTQSHKFPLHGVSHIGVKIKIYDGQADSFKPTDIVTFVGILSSESLHTDLDGSTSTLVPTLHVLFSRPVSSTVIPHNVASNLDADLRSELIDWIAHEGLAGDREAAEWVLLCCLARVQSRTPPIFPPCLGLSRFPSPTDPTLWTPAISDILSQLFLSVSSIPLSLSTVNATPFIPESKDEDLHSGWLQLPKGSICVVTEAGIQEGNIVERGLLNLRAMQEMMTSQILEYVFPFSSFSFETDVVFLVLCEGSKSAFFQTLVQLPLKPVMETNRLYKSPGKIQLPPKLDMFRQLVAKARVGSVSIGDQTATRIQEDFVNGRRGGNMTADDLIQRMSIARLLALSYDKSEVDEEMWEKAKSLERSRRQRIDGHI
ncbi:uncharacterized protein BT62DRAFT_925445 [Guyanagaster necrorhizus]|uniref:Mini-chromosome maintenance complex-binding protein n=1 Tax=Guyanagaster necrorhizus TaxID=856835 RepID=A0A9P7W5M3_9AGAR|nr:uncharacterized protein BT62DRAFT_925445 [Guyanagaster necrorhizus MCA 3950]KAG7452905.1 hypothetical protein BT62DRAFT_925445 [Guyanagaster necrorhizus MCA 3950]